MIYQVHWQLHVQSLCLFAFERRSPWMSVVFPIRVSRVWRQFEECILKRRVPAKLYCEASIQELKESWMYPLSQCYCACIYLYNIRLCLCSFVTVCLVCVVGTCHTRYVATVTPNSAVIWLFVLVMSRCRCWVQLLLLSAFKSDLWPMCVNYKKYAVLITVFGF